MGAIMMECKISNKNFMNLTGQVVAMANPLYGQEAIVNGMRPIASGTIDAQLQKFMCSQKTAR
jgi:hypothetical protein